MKPKSNLYAILYRSDDRRVRKHPYSGQDSHCNQDLIAVIDIFPGSAQEWAHLKSSMDTGRDQRALSVTVDLFCYLYIQGNEDQLPSVLYPLMTPPRSNGEFQSSDQTPRPI